MREASYEQYYRKLLDNYLVYEVLLTDSVVNINEFFRRARNCYLLCGNFVRREMNNTRKSEVCEYKTKSYDLTNEVIITLLRDARAFDTSLQSNQYKRFNRMMIVMDEYLTFLELEFSKLLHEYHNACLRK